MLCPYDLSNACEKSSLYSQNIANETWKETIVFPALFWGFCDRGHHLALNFCHDPAHLIIKPALCLCFHGIWWSTYMSTYSYMISPRIPTTTRDSNHHQDKLACLTLEISTKKPSFWEPLVRSCFFGYRFVPWEKKPSRSLVANEGKNLNG